MKTIPILLLAVLAFDTTTLADDFTRFRGADATGVAKDHPELPEQWTKTENVKWVVDVPGQGWGSPIVVGNRVFVSAVVADEENTKPKGGLYLGRGVRDPAKGIHHWMVYCFDLRSGKRLWQHEAHVAKPVVPRHPKSSYAAETPTTDGKRLFVLFGDLGLFCYSLKGDLLWSHLIEPKKTNMDYGAAASPVVHEGQVFVVYDNKEDSWIASFDAETGDRRWVTKRNETMSWATPFVWENKQRTEIVVSGQKSNRSYSLDGKELWSFDGKMSVLVIPSPFAAHGMCYLSSGYVGDAHRPTFAIRPGAKGQLEFGDGFASSEFIEWYQPRASPYNTTQIVYGKYLYTVYDQGFMTCHNALTGKEVYGKRRFSPKGSFTASPWAYNGKVFCLNEDGLTYVVKAGPEFEILNTNKLDELCIATPSVVDDKLLVRTLTKVYCIAKEKSATTKRSNEPSSKDQPELTTGKYFITQSWSQEKEFDRPFYVNVPRNTRQRKMPVFIFLHGNGGDARQAMRAFLRHRPKIASRYITVFPQGYRESWNIVAERSKANDLEFVESIVKKLADFEIVADTGFTVMGNSNGAALVNQLAIESQLGDIRNYISGVSPLNVWQHDDRNFKAKGDDNNYQSVAQPMKGKRLLNISGTKDRLVPYRGGLSRAIPAKNGKLGFVAAEKSTFLWAKQMGYEGKQLTKPTATDENLQFFSYLNGSVVHCRAEGEGHGAANAVSEDCILDFLNPKADRRGELGGDQ